MNLSVRTLAKGRQDSFISGWEHRFLCQRQIWVGTPIWQLCSCVILGKSLTLSEPRRYYYWN